MKWKVYFLGIFTWLILSTAPAQAGPWKRLVLGLALYPSALLHAVHLPSGYDRLQEAFIQNEIDTFYFDARYKSTEK